MLNITLVTGVWKRPEVFKLFAKGVKDLPYDLRVIVSGSEGRTSRSMVVNEGFEYIEVRNRPLGNKMNQPVVKAKGSDYVICMGSDDILSPELFKLYLRYMKLGFDFIGLEDFYFYDLNRGKALYWGGYTDRKRKGKTVGAGRCLSAKLLDSMDWQPWDAKRNQYLDASMNEKISSAKKKKVINLKKRGLMAVDLKSSKNITPFQRWDNSLYIDPKLIKDHFHYLP